MKCLKSFDKFGVITYLTDGDKTYIECIVESAIPFQPGVYLVYGIKAGNVYDLLYFGKAGVTQNKGKPLVNRHQIPSRLLATTQVPKGHKNYVEGKRIDISRADLWPWLAKKQKLHGLKIYWYITWPQHSPITVERKIRKELKGVIPEWSKR